MVYLSENHEINLNNVEKEEILMSKSEKNLNDIEVFSKKTGNIELAYDQWNIAVDHSAKTVDNVIDTLDPRAVVFTSISAGNTFFEANGKYSRDKRVIYTFHSAYPFMWHKALKSLDGKTGKEVMEEGLGRIFR